mmetsp:Transcript_200/g.176  ORF Transcript_200/g.176 Transcript_200/m.176 type:complete len:83 (-) Transcript_200:442-690(-)
MNDSVKLTASQTEKSNKPFRERFSFEQRRTEALKKKFQNPGMIPIIVEKHRNSKLENISSNKFLVFGEVKFFEFQSSVRNRL